MPLSVAMSFGSTVVPSGPLRMVSEGIVSPFGFGDFAAHNVASQVICWETELKHYFMNVKRCFRQN